MLVRALFLLGGGYGACLENERPAVLMFDIHVANLIRNGQIAKR